jgi:hypothetical protein
MTKGGENGKKLAVKFFFVGNIVFAYDLWLCF